MSTNITFDKSKPNANIHPNHINADIDVAIEWLYKGKRKNKIRSVSTTNNIKINDKNNTNSNDDITRAKTGLSTSTNDQRSRSNSNSNSISIASSSSNNHPEIQLKHSTDKELKTEFNSKGTRSRSSSVSNAVLNSSLIKKNTLDSNPRTHSKKSSVEGYSSSNANANANSHSDQSPSIKTQKLRRSTSMSTEKPIRSLLGSLFGRKNQDNKVKEQQHHSHPNQPSNIGDATNNSTTSVDSNNNNTSSTPDKDVKREIPNKINTDINNNNNNQNFQMNVGSPDFESFSPMLAKKYPSELYRSVEMNDTDKIDEILKIPLKRVKFAVDEFDTDPPQQLPSRKPKLGNVLIPDEMISDIPTISLGINNSADSRLRKQMPTFTKDSKEYKIALENYKKSLKQAEKHQQEAHNAAERIAKEVKNFKINSKRRGSISFSKVSSNEDDIPENEDSLLSNKVMGDITNINIDNPLHVHEHYFSTDDLTVLDESDSDEVTLDIIYTRCCHLREILPIPSTLRQVRGKTAPLQTLKFLNPRPTLIDILSFCDFIAVVPIHTVIFDNVSLNSEMLNIILTSLVNSNGLDKIGLRNVVINQDDWKVFCKFLLENKSLTKLDISQTKTRSDLPLKNHREYMDWDLLCQVLKKRKGKPLEELLLNGVKVAHIPLVQFQCVLNIFASRYNASMENSVGLENKLSGVKLGLANSEIDEYYLSMICDWVSEYRVQGIDLSFNPMDSYLKLLAKKFSRLNYDNLQYFTLNNTYLTNVVDLSLLLKYLCRLPNVKFLDMSNIPDVFPNIIPYLYKYLPRFPSLKRIHLDHDNFTYRQMLMICNILVKCVTLSHISLMQDIIPNREKQDEKVEKLLPNTATSTIETSDEKQRFFSRNTVLAAFYSLVRDSPNLVSLDINYEQISDEIQSRIALCLMRNMQKLMDVNFTVDSLSSQDQLLFDGSLIAETADDVLKKLNENSSLDADEDNDGKANPNVGAARKYLLKKYLEKLEKLLKNVQEAIDDVFERRKTGDIPVKEKENLLRLLLLEKNLRNIMDVFASLTNFSSQVTMISGSTSSSSSSPSTPMTSDSNNPNEDYDNDKFRPFLKHLDSARLMLAANSEDHEADPTIPHTVATESDQIVYVDTGRPVLNKSSSVTSIQSKLQEKEEGELHRWGFFVQQQRSLYPNDQGPVVDDPLNKEKKNGDGNEPPNSESEVKRTSSISSGNKVSKTGSPNLGESPKILSRIPSGEELRKAIIKAKGVDHIDDLIQTVSANDQELEKIYNAAYLLNEEKEYGDNKKDDSIKEEIELLKPAAT